VNPLVTLSGAAYSREIQCIKKFARRNGHEQSVRTQTMKIAQNEIFFVGSKD